MNDSFDNSALRNSNSVTASRLSGVDYGWSPGLSSVVIILLALVASSCASGTRGKLLPNTEVVLTPGMTITATNPNGTVSVHADAEATRTFSGTGWRKRTRLIPRTTRWYGSLGLYDPAGSCTPYGRLLVDEGRLFFQSESEALRYLNVAGSYMKPVFTSDGLVVGFHVEPIRGGEPTRSIDVWQIYINGRKPTAMRGANDTAISISGGATPETASPNPAPIGYELELSNEEYKP